MKRIAALAVGLALSFLASAQDAFPTKPVRIIVPYPAGGPADLLPRVVGEKLSQKWGQPVVIVCDGTPEAAKRIARVLRNDPGTGVMRHADAGYEEAIATAKKAGLDLPMID